MEDTTGLCPIKLRSRDRLALSSRWLLNSMKYYVEAVMEGSYSKLRSHIEIICTIPIFGVSLDRQWVIIVGGRASQNRFEKNEWSLGFL